MISTAFEAIVGALNENIGYKAALSSSTGPCSSITL